MPADELKQAAQIHRRWRGIGAVLFVVFYSFFFSLHFKLEKTAVYMSDGSWPALKSASVFNDLVLPLEHAGSKGTGKGSAFLLLHHPPARLLVRGWTLLTGSESAARRHAAGTFTAGAGAMMVLLMYQALMWAGLARLRAMIMAGILGCSVSVMFMAMLPQPLIFSALGLTAVLAVVARGRSARTWEFPAAAFYAMCCSPWNLIPVFLMGAISAAPAFRGRGFVRPIFGLLGGGLVLAALVLGAMKLQIVLYPHTVVDGSALAENWKQALTLAADQTLDKSTLAYALSSGVALPDWVVSFAKGPFPMIIWGWRFLLLMAALGLIAAVRRSAVPLVAALMALGWCVWFGALEFGDVQTPQALWMPFLIFVVALGLEAYARHSAYLRWPVAMLQGVFLAFLVLHNTALLSQFWDSQAR